MFNGPHITNDLPVVFLVNIGDNIANTLGGFQVLTGDIDTMTGQNLVDIGQNAGNIMVNMN